MYRRASAYVTLIQATPEGLEHDFISSYVVRSGETVCIIETGPASSAQKIIRVLDELNWSKELYMVIPTHIHLDHGGGLGHILDRYDRAVGLVHPRAYNHVLDPSKLWKAALEYLGWLAEIYGEPKPANQGQLRQSHDGMELVFGDITLTVLHTPGHAAHHQSIYLHNEESMFVGDSAGAYAGQADTLVPTTNPPIKLDLYLQSIDKMIKYRPKRLYYTHYGYVDDGEEVLKSYKSLITELVEIARESNPSSIDEFKSILIKSIDGIDRLLNWINDMPIYKSLMDLSLYGIMLSK